MTDPRRELERQHQPRTLRLVGGDLEPRVSRVDEQRIADDARERRDAGLRAEREAFEARLTDAIAHAERAADHVRETLGRVTREDYRDLDRIRRAYRAIKSRHLRADTP